MGIRYPCRCRGEFEGVLDEQEALLEGPADGEEGAVRVGLSVKRLGWGYIVAREISSSFIQL